MPSATYEISYNSTHLRDGVTLRDASQYHRGGLLLGQLPTLVHALGIGQAVKHDASSVGYLSADLNVIVTDKGVLNMPMFSTFTVDARVFAYRDGVEIAGIVVRAYTEDFEFYAETISDAQGAVEFFSLPGTLIHLLPVSAGEYDASVVLQEYIEPVQLNPYVPVIGTPASAPINPEPIYNAHDGAWLYNGQHYHAQVLPIVVAPPPDPDDPEPPYRPPLPVYVQVTREALHLLPPNATQQEKDLSLSIARAGAIPAALKGLVNADTCPRHLLTWLAWSLSVDIWDNQWSENRKREVIRSAIDVHRYKGTSGAIVKALTAMGYPAAAIDDSSPDLEPFQFRVVLGVTDISAQNNMDLIKQRIDQFKNTRSQLKEIKLYSLFHNGFASHDGVFNYSGDIND